MSNESRKGGWHCPGRIVPPSVPRVLSRAEIEHHVSVEARLNYLFGWLDDPTAWPWRDTLAQYDRDHANAA